MQDHQGSYEGEWFNGRKKGKGKFAYLNGATYDGQWEDDVRHGKGILEDATGYVRIYKGEWYDDLPQGRGTVTLANGAVYEGQLQEGLVRFDPCLFFVSPHSATWPWNPDERERRG